MSELLIKREDTVLVVIDFQGRLMPGIHDKDKVTDAAARLIKGCRILDVPVLVTQQYTKGLGETIPEIKEACTCELSESVPRTGFAHIEKTTFSAMREPAFEKALADTGKKTVIITGTEAHICVQQTAIDLLIAGYTVFGAVDCMSSRTPENKEFGQIRMTQSGMMVTGYESVLFDLLADARDSRFKQISAIVK